MSTIRTGRVTTAPSSGTNSITGFGPNEIRAAASCAHLFFYRRSYHTSKLDEYNREAVLDNSRYGSSRALPSARLLHATRQRTRFLHTLQHQKIELSRRVWHKCCTACGEQTVLINRTWARISGSFCFPLVRTTAVLDSLLRPAVSDDIFGDASRMSP